MEENTPVPETGDPTSEYIQPPKRKFGLKLFTFLGGLLDIALAAYVFGTIYMVLSQYNDLIEQGGWEGFLGHFLLPLVILFYVVLGFGGILFFIFGLITIISSFKSDKKNWGGLVVASLVFDFLILIFGAFIMLLSGGNLTILYGLFAGLALAIIFKIADLIIIRHRNKKYLEKKQQYLEATGQTAVKQIDKVDFSKLGEQSDLKDKK